MNNLIYNSLLRYFHILSTFGYKKYTDVEKMLVLVYVRNLISIKDKLFLSDEECQLLRNVVNSLTGTTCLIPNMGSSCNCNTRVAVSTGSPSFDAFSIKEIPQTVNGKASYSGVLSLDFYISNIGKVMSNSMTIYEILPDSTVVQLKSGVSVLRPQSADLGTIDITTVGMDSLKDSWQYKFYATILGNDGKVYKSPDYIVTAQKVMPSITNFSVDLSTLYLVQRGTSYSINGLRTFTGTLHNQEYMKDNTMCIYVYDGTTAKELVSNVPITSSLIKNVNMAFYPGNTYQIYATVGTIWGTTVKSSVFEIKCEVNDLVYYGEMTGTPDSASVKNGSSKRVSAMSGNTFEIDWKTLTTQYVAVPSAYSLISIINVSPQGVADDIWYNASNTSLYSVSAMNIDNDVYNVYKATRSYPMNASAVVTLQAN